MARQFGPVTGACTTGAAGAILLVGALDRLGWQITAAEAGALGVLLTAIGGVLVKGKGERVALE